MTYPIKSKYSTGDRIKTVPAAWYNWVANFFNNSRWQGIKFISTTSGIGCIIAINVDDVTMELDSDKIKIRIKDKGISEVQLADGAVTNIKLAADSVETEKIKNANVTTEKIKNANVTASKLANTSVSAGAYTTADITVDAQGRLTAAADGTPTTTGLSGTYSVGIPANWTFENGLLVST